MVKHKKIKARLSQLEYERDLLWDCLDQLYTALQAPGKHHLNLERRPEWLGAWSRKLSPLSNALDSLGTYQDAVNAGIIKPE